MNSVKYYFCKNCQIYFSYCVKDGYKPVGNFPLHCFQCSSYYNLAKIFPSEKVYFKNIKGQNIKSVIEYDDFDIFYYF